jgi:WD40 repeat protein/tRNA A-37 threonylcarbamoyl transferase component Bud32
LAEQLQCGNCGLPLPEDAPAGLCPRCLLRTAADAGAGDGSLRYFGDYELLAEVGRGGMGVVYKARQVSLDRIVAVKMMRPGLLATEDEIRRFHSEAKAAAALRHPGIAAIHEIGEQDGLFYYSMDFIAGRSLAAIVREQPLPQAEAARCCRLIAEAVDFAHRANTLHRDLKPSNIMIDEQGQPHITDFGLAGSVTADASHSLTGTVMGTPAYMSPEQGSGRGKGLTAASDVYSLGAILYESITGRPPFHGEGAFETIRMVIDSPPVSPRVVNPKLSRDLETIVLKCLEKDPHRRYQTAGEFADDLGRFIQGEPVQARRQGAIAHGWKWCRRHPWPTAAVTAIVLLAVASGFAALQFRERLFESVLRQAELQRLMRNPAEAATLLKQAVKIDATVAVRQEAIEQSLTPGAQLLFSIPVGDVTGYAFSVDSKSIGARGVYFTGLSGQSPLPSATKVWSVEPYRPLGKPTLHVADFDCYCACARGPSIPKDIQLDKASRIIPQFAAYSPDKRLYAATVVQGNSYSIQLWDMTTGDRIAVLPQNWQPVWSPDGRLLATTGGGDVTVQTGEHGTASQNSENGSVPGITMSATHVVVWKINAPAPVYHVPEAVTSLSFSPDSKQLVANGLVWADSERLGHYAMYDNSGRLFEAEIQKEGWPVDKIGDGHGVRIWEQTPERREILLHNPGYHDMTFRAANARAPGVFMEVRQVVISPDGHRAVIRSFAVTRYPGHGENSGDQSAVELWDLDSGTRLTVLRVENPQRRFDAVAFSPDGRTLAAIGYNGAAPNDLYLWDAVTGRFLREIPDQEIQNGLLVFAPDSNRVFAVMFDRMIAFDLQSNRVIRSWKLHGDSIRTVAVSPDGGYLASGGDDGEIRVWRTSDGAALGAWNAQSPGITAIAFSPSGATLATGAQDGSLRVWDMAAIRGRLSALNLGF